MNECFDKVDLLTSWGLYLANGQISSQIIIGLLSALVAALFLKSRRSRRAKIAGLIVVLIVAVTALLELYSPHTRLELVRPLQRNVYSDTSYTWVAQYRARGRATPCAVNNLEWYADSVGVIPRIVDGRFTPLAVGSTIIIVRDRADSLSDSARVEVLSAFNLRDDYPNPGKDSVWSYDYAQGVGKALIRMPNYIRDPADESQVWEADIVNRVPRIQRHSSDVTSIVGLHPDSEHRPAIVAWRSPAAASFLVTAKFSTVSSGTSLYYVYDNESLLDQAKVPNRFARVIRLNKGDIVKFEVDYEGAYLVLLTGLDVAIQQLPSFDSSSK